MLTITKIILTMLVITCISIIIWKSCFDNEQLQDNNLLNLIELDKKLYNYNNEFHDFMKGDKVNIELPVPKINSNALISRISFYRYLC